MHRLSRSFVAIAGAALVTAAVADAAAAAPPSAKALKPYGLTVSWPVTSSSTVAPGTPLVVTLRAGGRARAGRRPAARVTLVRLAEGSGRRATLVSRLLRRGTGRVAFTLPAAAGATYELRLKVRGKLFSSRLSVPVQAPVVEAPRDPASPPADVPSTPKEVVNPPVVVCDGPPRLEVVPDDGYDERYLEVTYVNVGASSLTYTYGFTIERRTAEGDWVEVPLGGGFPAVVRELRCRETVTYRWPIADSQPGEYRLITNTFRTSDDSTSLPGVVLPFAITDGGLLNSAS